MTPHPDRPQPPADQGLSSLGLLMSLAGSVMAPLVCAVLITQIKVSADRAAALSRFGSEGDGQTLWLFLILIASVTRSLVHRMAGMRLWREVPTDPPALSGITTYAIAAAGHTALWVVYMKVKLQAPFGALLGVVALMMAWPAAIFLITRARRFQWLGPRLPVAEDNGFEGLAVLMAILGFAGLMCSGVVLVVGFSMRDEQAGLANVLLLAGVALVVRSIIHLSVGGRAARGSAVTSAPDFLRYGNVGMAIGAGVGGLLTLWMMVNAPLDIFAIAVGVAVMLALMAWPAIVRRFVTWRHLADVATDNVRGRSPDAGLTALGWLLLAGASVTLGAYAAELLWKDALGGHTTDMVMRLAGMPFNQEPAWWVLPLGLGELWAALELLAVSPRRRLVASVWGLAAVAATTIATAPHLARLLDLPLQARAIGFATFFVGISPAVATVLLVNRATVPTAVARIVKPAA